MIIAVSMGDPHGVGPELAVTACAHRLIPGSYAVIGDVRVLRFCAEKIGAHVEIASTDIHHIREGRLNVIDVHALGEEDIHPGELSKNAGQAARRYIVKAVETALANEADAVVTLPVNKEAIRLTDGGFSGHTGLIAELCGNPPHTMMLSSPKLIVTHVSTHVSLSEAILAVQADRVGTVIQLTAATLKQLSRGSRIAVAGLNPHAGEGGSFGTEEIDHIIPAIERAKATGIDVSGPHPPDTVFMKAARGAFDAVVAMYHDQGHIPAKVLDFEGGVNTTLGLPIVRTSVDHGTAFDIAYQGKADTRSFVEAYNLARQLADPEGR